MFINTVQRTCRISTGMLLLGFLAACASDAPERQDAITSLADVDLLSPGVIAIVQSSGQVDLNNDPRIVCEKRAPTGSNIPKMICMTRDEKRAMSDQAERELAMMQQEWDRKYDVYTKTR